MQVAVLQDNFSAGLNIVQRAVARRNPLPVLGNILVEAAGGRLKLAATDLAMGVMTWVGARIETEGAITVPASTLADLVDMLPPDQVHLALDAETQTLSLKCAGTKANIKGISAEEFPLMQEIDPNGAIYVPADTFASAVNAMAFAAAQDNSRPILTGVLAQFEDDRLTLAAADGFRLAVRTVALETPVAEPMTLIIPARALSEIARVARSADDTDIAIARHRDNQVLARVGGVQLTAQLVDGAFPEYQQIIPKGHKTRVLTYTSELLRACKRSLVFARESAYTVRFRVEGEDKLIVSAVSQETGDNRVEVGCEVAGPAVEIAFNVRYVIDALGAVETEQVVLELNDASNPGVLRPVGVDGAIYVAMPMQIHR